MAKSLNVLKSINYLNLLKRLSIVWAILIVLIVINLSNYYYLEFVGFYFVSFGLLTLSWDFLYSYSGQLSLGQAFQYGVGAFVTIFVIGHSSIPFYFSLLLGALAASAAGGAVGFTTIRLRPGYQGIALLLFSQIFYYFTYVEFGEEGYSVFSLSALSVNTIYLLGVAILIPSLAFFTLMQRSKYRLKLLAIKGDTLAADVCGINVKLHKTYAFLISSFFAGLGGSFFAVFSAHADYTVLNVANNFFPIAMAIIGGMGLTQGAVLGTAIVVSLINILPIWLTIPVTYIIYGVTAVTILRVVPAGLTGIFRKKR